MVHSPPLPPRLQSCSPLISPYLAGYLTPLPPFIYTGCSVVMICVLRGRMTLQLDEWGQRQLLPHPTPALVSLALSSLMLNSRDKKETSMG